MNIEDIKKTLTLEFIVNSKVTMYREEELYHFTEKQMADFIDAVVKKLTIPVVVGQSEQLCQYKTCNKKNYMYGYCKHHLAQQDL